MTMSEDREPPDVDEEYDEEADSDFDGNRSNDDVISSSSDDDADDAPPSAPRKKSRGGPKHDDHLELDSGDEATIRERQRATKRQQKKDDTAGGASDNEASGWRAKTRAMRAQDKEERKRNRLVSSKGSTIDVDKIWEIMNQPGPLPPIRMEDGYGNIVTEPKPAEQLHDPEENKENLPVDHGEEVITIKRKFHFAGEVHEEEKTVPKSSAEARLWLAQQDRTSTPQPESQSLIQRPLRKVSRFDPNYNNLAAFKTNFVRSSTNDESFKGPRLNVVEKSKMDWAAHVDAEGLKDELDIHAKAKEGYHGRMDFLSQVEQRKEEEARLARMKK